MTITIYHNPKCSKSRETLAIIREAGIEPNIIEYLKSPLNVEQITQLITDSGLSVRDAIRTDVDAYQQITPEMSDNDIFALIAQYPNLLNRPFVSGQKGTKLCRPPELVNNIIIGKTMKSILLLNGPNLNMLGKREPHIYGSQTLSDIEQHLKQQAEAQGFAFDYFQANGEEPLINRIHQGFQKVDFIIINPGAFTHTSVALRDALLSVAIPFIEVHLSNVHAREPFRHHSYLSDVAKGVICGLGAKGYDYALDYAIQFLKNGK